MNEYLVLNKDTILKFSKIGSNHTYYNSLHNLHEWGYIEYFPKQTGENLTKIRLIIFEYSDEDYAILDEMYGAKMHRAEAYLHSGDADMHSVVHRDSAFMHSISADMHPFSAYLHPTRCISASLYKVLKYLKDKESVVKYNVSQNSISQKTAQSPLENFSKNEELEKRKKVPQKKENEFSSIPTESETNHFFVSNNSNLETAQKFHNHYSATGWVTKNNVPIVDWQSAAKLWISNERITVTTQAGNYDEAF